MTSNELRAVNFLRDGVVHGVVSVKSRKLTLINHHSRVALLLGGSGHRALIKISLSTRSVESLQICGRLVLFGSVAHNLRVLHKACVYCLLYF